MPCLTKSARTAADKDLLRRNQFGFNVAGPGRDCRTSSTATAIPTSRSPTRACARISPAPTLQTIPTVAQRTGDYSDVVDAAGNVLPIYDPATTSPNPAYDPTQPVSTSNLQYLRDPFPGNASPPTGSIPVAQKALQYYPAPNTDVGPFFQNNYFIDAPETNTANGMIGKLDQSVRERHRITLELAFSDGTLGAAAVVPHRRQSGPRQPRVSNPPRIARIRLHRLQPHRQYVLLRSQLQRVGQRRLPRIRPTMQAPQWACPACRKRLSADAAGPVSVHGSGLSVFPERAQCLSPRPTASRPSAASTLSLIRQVHFPAGEQFLAAISRRVAVLHRRAYQSARHRRHRRRARQPSCSERHILPRKPSIPSLRISAARKAHWPFAIAGRRRKGLTINSRTHTAPLHAAHRKIRPPVRHRSQRHQPGQRIAGRAGGRRAGRLRQRFSAYTRAAGSQYEHRLESARTTPQTVVRASFARSYSGIPIYFGQFGTQGFNLYPTFLSPDAQLQPALVLRNGVPLPATPLPDLQPDAANNTIADLIDMTTACLPTSPRR